MHLQFSPHESGVTAPFTPQPNHQGFDNVVHGGIISAVLNEAKAWATTRAGVWVASAEKRVRLKTPLAVGEPMTVSSRVADIRGKFIGTTATSASDRDRSIIATATATFVRVSDTLANEWRQKYLEDVAEAAIAGPTSANPDRRESGPGE